MREKFDDDNRLSIQFPGAAPSYPAGEDSLARIYDQSRQVAFRVGLPIIGDKLSPLNRRINEAGTDELTESVDAIYLASCARLAIRETARYEEMYNRLLAASGCVPALLSSNAQLEQIRIERDTAMASLLAAREKIARIKRLEGMVERTGSVLEQVPAVKKRRSGAV